MRTVSHLLFGNHPKSGKLKARTAAILRIMKENGGRIDAKELERRTGVSRTESPSMFYKPLAAMRRWNLIETHKSVSFGESGEKVFRTEYELTPERFYRYIQENMIESVKREMEAA